MRRFGAMVRNGDGIEFDVIRIAYWDSIKLGGGGGGGGGAVNNFSKFHHETGIRRLKDSEVGCKGFIYKTHVRGNHNYFCKSLSYLKCS